MSKPDNPSAFPRPSQGYIQEDGQHVFRLSSNGMSLLDYYAGQAMAAIISGVMSNGSSFKDEDISPVANASFAMARGMLAERERGQ